MGRNIQPEFYHIPAREILKFYYSILSFLLHHILHFPMDELWVFGDDWIFPKSSWSEPDSLNNCFTELLVSPSSYWSRSASWAIGITQIFAFVCSCQKFLRGMFKKFELSFLSLLSKQQSIYSSAFQIFKKITRNFFVEMIKDRVRNTDNSPSTFAQGLRLFCLMN